ncbi:hypothetical protein M8J76_002256 [Diaphorina citri]|nr:hypothetical protein M8J76_002256 [Diaphorina citri]
MRGREKSEDLLNREDLDLQEFQCEFCNGCKICQLRNLYKSQLKPVTSGVEKESNKMKYTEQIIKINTTTDRGVNINHNKNYDNEQHVKYMIKHNPSKKLKTSHEPCLIEKNKHDKIPHGMLTRKNIGNTAHVRYNRELSIRNEDTTSVKMNRLDTQMNNVITKIKQMAPTPIKPSHPRINNEHRTLQSQMGHNKFKPKVQFIDSKKIAPLSDSNSLKLRQVHHVEPKSKVEISYEKRHDQFVKRKELTGLKLKVEHEPVATRILTFKPEINVTEIEKELQVTRSKLNEKINQFCLIKTHRDRTGKYLHSYKTRLQSAIKLNQNKFFREKYEECELNSCSTTDVTDGGSHRITDVTDGGSHRITDVTDGGSHRITDVTDGGSHRITDVTDGGSHRITDVTDGGSHRITDVTDGGSHRITDVTDGGSHRITDVTDSGSHRITDVTDGGSHRITDVTYGGSHRITDVTDGGSHRITDVTDGESHRITDVTDGGSHRITDVTYGGSHRITDVTDGESHRITDVTDGGSHRITDVTDGGFNKTDVFYHRTSEPYQTKDKVKHEKYDQDIKENDQNQICMKKHDQDKTSMKKCDPVNIGMKKNNHRIQENQETRNVKGHFSRENDNNIGSPDTTRRCVKIKENVVADPIDTRVLREEAGTEDKDPTRRNNKLVESSVTRHEPVANLRGRKDVATYIAPMKHIERKLNEITQSHDIKSVEHKKAARNQIEEYATHDIKSVEHKKAARNQIEEYVTHDIKSVEHKKAARNQIEEYVTHDIKSVEHKKAARNRIEEYVTHDIKSVEHKKAARNQIEEYVTHDIKSVEHKKAARNRIEEYVTHDIKSVEHKKAARNQIEEYVTHDIKSVEHKKAARNQIEEYVTHDIKSVEQKKAARNQIEEYVTHDIKSVEQKKAARNQIEEYVTHDIKSVEQKKAARNQIEEYVRKRVCKEDNTRSKQLKRCLQLSNKPLEKDFFSKRIEKYKNEYSRMNESIKDNVKLINKYTAGANCNFGIAVDQDQVTNMKSTIHVGEIANTVTLISLQDNDEKHSRYVKLTDKPLNSKANLEDISHIKLEIENKKQDISNIVRNYKMQIQSKQGIDKDKTHPARNGNKDESPHTPVRTPRQGQTEKAQNLNRNVNTMWKSSADTCEVVGPSRAGNNQNAYNVLSVVNYEQTGGGDVSKVNMSAVVNYEQTGGGDVSKVNMSAEHPARKLNMTDNGQMKIRGEEEYGLSGDKVFTLVDQIKQLFGSIRLHKKIDQSSSEQNTRVTMTTSKQSDCIRLKLNRVLLKESESDGKIFRRRRQVKQNMRQHCRRNFNYEKMVRETFMHPCGGLLNSRTTITARDNNNPHDQSSTHDDCENEFQRCTEYFIQHLKSSHPELIHHSTQRKLSIDQKKRDGKVSMKTYKQQLDTRKQGTRKIMQHIDEKLEKLNLKLRKKFLQDKTEITRDLQDSTPGQEASIQNNPLITLNTNRLNLDQVFANKNNWITLDIQDEHRIRTDINQLLTQ